MNWENFGVNFVIPFAASVKSNRWQTPLSLVNAPRSPMPTPLPAFNTGASAAPVEPSTPSRPSNLGKANGAESAADNAIVTFGGWNWPPAGDKNNFCTQCRPRGPHAAISLSNVMSLGALRDASLAMSATTTSGRICG